MNKLVSLVPLFATIIIMIPFILTLSWCPDVEGLRVGDISSTIIHGKGLISGAYPLWNHLDGIGLPHPYATNLIYHPIVFLFGIFRFDWVILILYLGHALLGSYSLWYLCKYFHMKRVVIVICVLTYLMSSPSLNYLVGTDFWPTCLIIWTGLPLLLLLICMFLDSEKRYDQFLLATAIATVSGFIAINSHLGALAYSLIGLSLFVLANSKRVLHHWFSSMLIVVLFSLIFSEKFYAIYSEYIRFSPISERFYQYLPPDFLSMFLWPLKTRSIENSYKALHYRTFFMGCPFVFLAFAGVLWPNRFFRYQRTLSIAAILCFILLFIPPQYISSNIVIANYLWRDPLTLYFIIIAGTTASYLYKKNKKMRCFIIISVVLQAITLTIGISPYWIRGFQRGLDYIYGKPAKVLRSYIESGPIIEAINNQRNDIGYRIAISNEIQKRFRYYSKLDYGQFRIHQMPLVNGLFKGIYYEDVSRNSKVMYSAINPDTRLWTKPNLDVLGIKYFIAFAGEIVPQNLMICNSFETEKGRIYLYKNLEAWPPARVIKYDSIDQNMSGKDLFHSDLSPIESQNIKNAVLQIERPINGFDIKINPQKDRTLLFINSYYRSAWKAKGTVSDKIIDLKVKPLMGCLISVVLPPGTSDVQLQYHPNIKIYLTIVTITSLIGCFFISVILLFYKVKNHRKSEDNYDL